MKSFLVVLFCLVRSSAQFEISGLERVRRVSPGTAVLLQCELNQLQEQGEGEGELLLTWSYTERGAEQERLVSSVKLPRGTSGEMEQGETQATVPGLTSLLVKLPSQGEYSWRYSWQLIIEDVGAEHSGVYQCKVSGPRSVSLWREILVEVGSEDAVEHEAQYILSKLGTEVTLDCTDFTGNSLKWTKAGLREHQLIKVDRPDSGVYICSVGEEMTNVQSEESSPIILTPPEPILQSVGQTASLECRVEGHPPPLVQWTGGDGDIIRNSDNVSVSITDFTNGVLTSSLVLEHISSQDYGNYSCFAENKMGQSSLSLELREVSEHSGSQRTGLSLLLACTSLSLFLAAQKDCES